MEIYAFAREYMKTHGNPNQWDPTNWPPEELIHNDIKEGDYPRLAFEKIKQPSGSEEEMKFLDEWIRSQK